MTKLRYRAALNEALREEMDRDPRVFLMGEDLRDPWGGTFRVTEGLSTAYGNDRVLNTPIAENGIVGVALGCALTGLRPVLELMHMDFAMMAMDQLVNQVPKYRYMTGGQASVPLVVRAPGGGYKSSAAQHGQCLEAFFAHIPGWLVAAPSNPADAKGLLKTAIRLDDPVFFMEHKHIYMLQGEVPPGEHLVPFGKADVKRTGTDCTIVAWSKMVNLSLDAAAVLAEEGIEAEVVDLRTLVPLDEETILDSVRKTGRLVIVQEPPERNGFGAEVAAIVASKGFEYLRTGIRRVAGRNVPLPMAPILENSILPQVDWIVSAVRDVVPRTAVTEGRS
jgi:acetoin:2,6-dichlorophenolindophenol oxidoreductase subunit beta